MTTRPAARGHRATSCGHLHRRLGGQPPRRPPNDIACHLAAGDGGGQPGAVTPTPLRCADDGLSPIHSTYYRYYLHPSPRCGKGRTVKFRCEREILADALATAGRAATSRTGTLPVLSGSAARGQRRRADGHRHRPRADDPADRHRSAASATVRWSCRPAWSPTSSGRCRPARSRSALADDEV